MRSFWSEPFLWIHLAGIAVVPLCLAACLLGLASGEPLLPVWMEMLLVATVGIVPVLWMQLVRPFNIFSVLIFAVESEQLTTQQKQILSLFKKAGNKVVAVVGAILLVGVLWQLYSLAPSVPAIAPLRLEWRGAGLLLAAIAFLLSNLFLQVPLSVCGVLVTSDSTFSETEAYPREKIDRDFTTPGWKVNRIWPFASVPTAPDSQRD
jgi:hypothetical protein